MFKTGTTQSQQITSLQSYLHKIITILTQCNIHCLTHAHETNQFNHLIAPKFESTSQVCETHHHKSVKKNFWEAVKVIWVLSKSHNKQFFLRKLTQNSPWHQDKIKNKPKRNRSL